MKKLILASASPRRRELLSRLTGDYTVMNCHDEEHSDAEAPFLRVQELAAHKARAIAAQLGPEPAVIIGSDTLVFERSVWKGMDEHASVLVAEKRDLVPGTPGHLLTVTGGNHSAGLVAGAVGSNLIENCEISVSEDDEVGRAMASNPRTAIGIVSEGHYVFIVADGRTGDDDGLTLYELAAFMQSLGVQTGYNLDGGGSSSMVFMGTVINTPTTNGRSSGERSVSDIVYIGYGV